jgi:hypothetical protein
MTSYPAALTEPDEWNLSGRLAVHFVERCKSRFTLVVVVSSRPARALPSLDRRSRLTGREQVLPLAGKRIGPRDGSPPLLTKLFVLDPAEFEQGVLDLFDLGETERVGRDGRDRSVRKVGDDPALPVQSREGVSESRSSQGFLVQ